MYNIITIGNHLLDEALNTQSALTKVDQMAQSVPPAQGEDEPAHHFVEVDAVVERELVGQPHVAEERHQVA